MSKHWLSIIGSVLLVAAAPLLASAQVPAGALTPTPPDVFYRAEVVSIVAEKEEHVDIAGVQPFSQTVKVKLIEGSEASKEVELTYAALKREQLLKSGEKVVVIAPGSADPGTYYIFEKYRLPSLGIIAIFFIALTVLLGRLRGAASLLGLAVSILVLAKYVVPQIMAGRNPLLVSFIGAVVIATLSIYLAHGFKRRTTVALISTLISIVIAMVLAVVFVKITRLLGIGSEEATYLQFANIQNINLQGLLLGGIIIGALGVLDDITTAQAAAVDEISRANPRLTAPQLFQRGLSVGREHITSLVNTLVLAYAGASFPALLLFTTYQRPLWVVLNTEVIAEEVVRTLVGSSALIFAVPITTLLAAYGLRRHHSGEVTTTVESHHHHGAV
ncbi:MAG: YibE/F family protein [Candidatus Andersenbacteria bacterium]